MNPTDTIPWSSRSDLQSYRIDDVDRPSQQPIAVKDAVRNEYFRFGELEHHILESLRKPVSWNQLVNSIAKQFGVRLEVGELANYLDLLAKDNLLVARRIGDGHRLAVQQRNEAQGRWWRGLMGMLSIKLPGFHPGGLLRSLTGIGWVAFHPITLVIFLICLLATILFVGLSWQSLWERAPALADLASPGHIALIIAGYLVAKALHELGHGLACQRVGHECNEMGVMFLVFMPCLYCDVSDLWTEPNRWKRILVSAAGVLVELAIAVACFWGWYFSIDGVLSRFLFGMMLVTSINTLFVNGNPLMRYDGYYVLSDWVRIPNLAAESSRYLKQQLESLLIQVEPAFRIRDRWVLSNYAWLSWSYRVFIMVAIGWGIWLFFENQQLIAAGRLTAGLIACIAAFPVLMSVRELSSSARKHGLRLGNALVMGGLLVVGYLCLTQIPLHHRVRSLAEVELDQPQHLFSPANGQLTAVVADGTEVAAGQLIAKVDDEPLELEQLQLEGELSRIGLRLAELEVAIDQAGNAEQVEFWKQREQSVQNRLTETQKRLAQLQIFAPVSGILVAARRANTEAVQPPQLELPEADVFSSANQGIHVTRGQRLGYIASPQLCRGIARVDEGDIELVQIGQPVQIFLDHQTQPLDAEVTRISLETEQDLTNNTKTKDNHEEGFRFFRVEFVFGAHRDMRVGSVHPVLILGPPTTPARIIQRWWRNSFWF